MQASDVLDHLLRSNIRALVVQQIERSRSEKSRRFSIRERPGQERNNEVR